MFSDTTGEVLWSITQINDATLSMTSETADVTDAIGNVITQFDRSKNAEFSGTNALWDFGLSAAQFGSDKVVASEDATVTTPIYEQLKVDEEHKVTLSHTPSNDVKFIYLLNNDSTLGEKYEVDATSTDNGNSFTIADNKISLSEQIAPGTNVAVFYDYDASAAIMLQNNASEFPKAGKFMLEVIGKDTCDKTAIYVAYIVFPNAKLRTDMDLSFASDGGHPFSLQMMQDYCDIEKRLFNIYVDVGEGLPNVTPQPKPEPKPEPEPEEVDKEMPKVPDQDSTISDRGDRKISDLITPETKIDENGKATGATHYIYHWEEFSTDESANSGNFFPIEMPEEWVGKKVKLVGSKNGDKTIEVDSDRLLIQRLENLKENKLSMTLVTTPVSSNGPIRRIGGFIKKISETGAGTATSKTIDFSEVETESSASGKEAVVVPGQTDNMDAVEHASALIGSDAAIEWDEEKHGKLKGHLHYYSFAGTEHFKSAPTGHFGAVVVRGHDKENISVTNSKGESVTLEDPKWIIRVDGFLESEDHKTTTISVGENTLATIDLSEVTLESPATVPEPDTKIGLGEKKVSDIATDLETTFDGDVVHVSGELHNFTGKDNDVFTEFSNDANLQKGHFVPIQFPHICAGKTVNLEGTSTTKSVQFTESDLMLVLRTDALTSTTVTAKLEDKELLKLDLKGVIPVGKDAAPVPSLTTSLGDGYGSVYDYLGDDINIDWEGAKGKVTGTIKWAKKVAVFGEGQNNGHYYPLILDDFFKNKEITVKLTQEKTAQDTVWLLYLDAMMNGEGSEKKLTVKYSDVIIVELDFSEATFQLPVGKDAVSIGKDSATYGSKPYSDFCDENTDIDWLFTLGSVDGTFYKDSESNYHLPLKFSDAFKNRTAIFKKGRSGDAVHADKETNDPTLYLVKLGSKEEAEHLTLTVKCDNQEIADITLAERVEWKEQTKAEADASESEEPAAEEPAVEEAPAEEAPAEE